MGRLPDIPPSAFLQQCIDKWGHRELQPTRRWLIAALWFGRVQSRREVVSSAALSGDGRSIRRSSNGLAATGNTKSTKKTPTKPNSKQQSLTAQHKYTVFVNYY